ncbi:MAG: hypothetical protein NZ651_06865 [Candidatus Bipolaricaulota bacterium]|nr:hypothetical protein [Candidatus Bipolaricaulota bacterium]MDW8127475.1 hypothetical protein [Candidatus Bipolaricaulota bacterium]
MPIPLPPPHDEANICFHLFDKKKYNRRSVRAILKGWGMGKAEINEGGIFWRVFLKEVPEQARKAKLLRLEDGVYALEILL